MQFRTFALGRESGDLGRADRPAVDGDVPRKNRNHRVVPFGQWKRQLRAGVEPHVPKIDGRERPSRPSRVAEGARDDPRPAAVERDGRNLRSRDCLIGRRRLLVLRGQVDPQLDHAKRAARFRVTARVEFLVDDSAAGGHPLDVARGDRPAAARGIAMADLTVVDDRHRFEPAMRVLTDAARRPFGGFEVVGPRIVEQQERADRLRIAVIREQRAHGESVTDPMAGLVLKNVEQGFHGFSSSGGAVFVSRRCAYMVRARHPHKYGLKGYRA